MHCLRRARLLGRLSRRQNAHRGIKNKRHEARVCLPPVGSIEAARALRHGAHPSSEAVKRAGAEVWDVFFGTAGVAAFACAFFGSRVRPCLWRWRWQRLQRGRTSSASSGASSSMAEATAFADVVSCGPDSAVGNAALCWAMKRSRVLGVCGAAGGGGPGVEGTVLRREAMVDGRIGVLPDRRLSRSAEYCTSLHFTATRWMSACRGRQPRRLQVQAIHHRWLPPSRITRVSSTVRQVSTQRSCDLHSSISPARQAKGATGAGYRAGGGGGLAPGDNFARG